MIRRRLLTWLLVTTSVLAFCTPVNAVLKIGADTCAQGDQHSKTLTANGTDAISQEVFNKMVASTETFTFADDTHAGQHFAARKAIVTTIGQMDANGAVKFGYGAPGAFTFPKGLVATRAGEFHFKQSSKTQPASAGIKAIEGGETRTECLTALHSAILIGHRRAYGDVWIDNKMPAGSVVIDGNFNFTAVAGDATHIPGDYVYMANPADYSDKAKAHGKTWAPWNGENTIYIGGGKYSGLGLLNYDEDALREELRVNYNTDTGESMTVDQSKSKITFTAQQRIVVSPKN